MGAVILAVALLVRNRDVGQFFIKILNNYSPIMYCILFKIHYYCSQVENYEKIERKGLVRDEQMELLRFNLNFRTARGKRVALARASGA